MTDDRSLMIEHYRSQAFQSLTVSMLKDYHWHVEQELLAIRKEMQSRQPPGPSYSSRRP